jgi:hypothetical protein
MGLKKYRRLLQADSLVSSTKVQTVGGQVQVRFRKW